MANGSYPSPSKPANIFEGARVDLANKKVWLHNAAVCTPSPAVIPTNQAWLGDWGNTLGIGTTAGQFTVYLANLAEYHFQLS